MGLSLQRLEFCRAYVLHGDAQKAALDAGYSASYAKANAYTLLKNDDVRLEIKRLREKVEDVMLRPASDVANLISRIAFTDPLSFLKPDDMHPGRTMFKAPDELTLEQRLCIRKINIKQEYKEVTRNKRKIREFVRETFTYEFKDPERALENMGRYYGIFDDKLRLTGRTDNPLAGLSTDKLMKIKQAVAKVMTEEGAVEGEFIEHKK